MAPNQNISLNFTFGILPFHYKFLTYPKQLQPDPPAANLAIKLIYLAFLAPTKSPNILHLAPNFLGNLTNFGISPNQTNPYHKQPKELLASRTDQQGPQKNSKTSRISTRKTQGFSLAWLGWAVTTIYEI